MPISDSTWVLIVDDSELLCNSLKMAFETYDDIKLVGTAWSGQEALDICRHFEPDVVLMDMMLPDMDGVEVTRRLRQQYPDLRVVFLSNVAHKGMMEAAFAAGASEYLVKHVSLEEIVDAVRYAWV
jgi:DNA-binding NarL/FixJ family response regulator